MISLFIDTSLSDVSIALAKDEKILSRIHKNIPGEHSIYVTKYIEDILKENDITPNEVGEIIVVNGPGSFTGVRIGVTIAKVFSYITNNRIVAISSLKARIMGKKGDYLLSTIDAKHSNYYVGLYDKDYNKITEEFASKEKIDEIIKEYNPQIITENDDYNIEEIIKYTKNIESENPHGLNPIYLKLPEAMEKNDKRS